MSSIAPTPVKEQYRPLSSLAVWGLLFGLAAPMVFFFDSAWSLFVLPFPGLALALLARRRIQHSNGALAGLVPATFGASLCLVTGLGWITHAMTRDWILESESRSFVEKWLDKLKTGRDGLAFLDTVEPAKRRIDFEPEPRNLKLHFPPPEGSTVPRYDVFRNASLASLILLFGPKVELTLLGRPEFKSVPRRENEFRLTYKYRLTAPVGTGTATIAVESSAVPVASGLRRDWYIWNQDFRMEASSEFGSRLREAEQSASHAMDRMAVLIADGEKDKLQSFFVPGSGTGDLDKLYEVIRDRKAGQTTFGVRKPMLLLDEKRQDRGWTMRFRGQFENDVREVEFEVTVTTPDLGLELDGWKYLSCRYLGERRRTKVQPVRMGGGELPAFPTNAAR